MPVSNDELAAQAAEQLRLHEKQKEDSEKKLVAAKSLQNASLQEKLNARLKKKDEKIKLEQEKAEKDKLKLTGLLKVFYIYYFLNKITESSTYDMKYMRFLCRKCNFEME